MPRKYWVLPSISAPLHSKIAAWQSGSHHFSLFSLTVSFSLLPSVCLQQNLSPTLLLFSFLLSLVQRKEKRRKAHAPTTSSPAFLPSHIIKRRRHLQLPGLPPLALVLTLAFSPSPRRIALAKSGEVGPRPGGYSNPRLGPVVSHGGVPLLLLHRGLIMAVARVCEKKKKKKKTTVKSGEGEGNGGVK